MADRSIRVILRAEIAGFKRAMDEAAASTKKVGKGAEESSKTADTALGRMVQSATRSRDAWTAVGGALATAGAAVTAVGVAAMRTGVQYNTLQQTTRAALTTLLGSARAANAQMDKLDAFARTSPFAKQTFITAQQQLLAFGVEAKKVIPYLDAVQNAVAAAGGSNADIAGIVETMAKIQSSAKLTATDLAEFGNRGVNAAELIGSQMGKTGAGIREDITDGALDATEALDALVAAMGDRFGGAADNVKNTFAGALDRVKAAWRDFGSELATPLVDPNGGGALVGMLNGIADAMRGFIKLPEPIKDTATAVGLVGGAAATAAGGFLLMTPRILDTIQAVRTLKQDFPVASKRLGALGKAAGAAAVAFTVLSTAGALIKSKTGDQIRGVEEVTRSLEILQIQGNRAAEAMISVGDSNWVDRLFTAEASRGWGWARDSMEGLADAARDLKYYGSGGVGTFSSLADAVGMIENPADNAREAFKNFDAALAGLVESGNIAAAADGARIVTSELLGAGFTSDEIARILSGYDGALELHNLTTQRTAEVTGDAADAAGALTTWQARLESQLASADPVIKDAAKSMQDLLDAAAGAGAAFRDFSDDLGDDKKFTLKGWLSKLEDEAKALEEWSANIRTLIDKGISRDFLQNLIDEGPNAAKAVKALADDTGDALARAQESFDRTQGAIQGVQDKLGETFVLDVDTSGAESDVADAAASVDTAGQNLRPWEIDADTQDAIDAARAGTNQIEQFFPVIDVGASTNQAAVAVDSFLARARGESVTIPIKWSMPQGSLATFVGGQRAGVGTVLAPGKAAGGPITGGIPGKDSVPALLMPGEHVLTTRDVAALGGQAGVYALRAALHGGVQAMASGGAVGHFTFGVPSTKGKDAQYWQSAFMSFPERFRLLEQIWSKQAEVAEASGLGRSASQGELDKLKAKLRDAEYASWVAKEDAGYWARVVEQERTASAKKETGSALSLAASRGNLAGSASAGLSGAQSLVDRLMSAGGDSALSGKQQSSLTKAATSAEKSYSKLYGTLTHVTDQLDAAKEKASELQRISDQTANALSGGFGLNDGLNPAGTTTNKWGETYATTGGGKAGILAAASAYASKVKALAGKITKLVAKGFSAAIVSEVGAAGVEGGTVMADALLSMSAAEVKRLNGDYAAIATYSAQAGQAVTTAYSKGGLSAANAQVGTLTAKQQKVQSQITGLSKQLEDLLLGAYGVPARAKGGPVWPGQPFLVGERGPELFTPQQSGYVLPADATRRLAASSPGGGQQVQVTTQVQPMSQHDIQALGDYIISAAGVTSLRVVEQTTAAADRAATYL